MITLLLALSRLVNLLPQRAILAIGDVIGWLWFYVFRFRRDVVEANLKLAFKDLSLSEIRTLTRRNFCHYGRTLMEIIQTVSWDKRKYRSRIIIEGLENVRQFTDSGQGGFFLTCHLGNWELAIGSAAAWDVPIDMVVKRARNRQAEAFLQWYRRKTGAGVFLEEGTAKDIIRSVNSGRFVGIVLDQFMGPPIGLPVNFFGETAGTAVALSLLTEKKQQPIVLAYSYRDEEGRVHTVFEPALKLPKLSENKDERLFEKTQIYNDALERVVRAHPEQWLWLHRRWKEYRGTPRWFAKPVFASLLSVGIMWGLLAPRNLKAEATTGIPLPADPKISVPTFHTVNGNNEEETSGSKNIVGLSNGEPQKTEETPKTGKKIKKKGKHVNLPVAVDVKEEAIRRAQASVPPVGFDAIPAERVPFEVGERMELDLSWTALPAGRAWMEVRQGPVVEGRPTYWLWGNVLSSKLVDTIYHVDNTIESFIDTMGLIPYKFLLHMVESAQLKETRVAFDHVDKKAFYWAKRISQKWGNESIDRADVVTPQARDMFSALYYARSLDFSLNQKQSFTVFENGKNLEINLLPVANEVVTSKAGAFQCWKIQVTVKLDNVLRPTGDMFMWFSDDSKKYLVKFDAKIKIGSLYGNLTSIKERK